MRKQTAYWLVISFLFLVALVIAIELAQTARWVGRTDVEIRFVVTDAQSNQPVPKAIVFISSEPDGFCDDSPQHEFTLSTDENGQAKYLATSCMCFGSKGTFEDTFGSHLPRWTYHVSASGYSSTTPTFLDVSENARRVERGDRFATLSVPILLDPQR